MNKKEYLKLLDELKLDKNDYCIIASGVMMMNGLREECDDIDLRVTEELFNNLMAKYHMKQSNRYDYVYELNNDIDVNCKDFKKENIEFIDGYPVESLQIQLEWMIKNNRKKDQEKIKIIKEYLNKK